MPAITMLRYRLQRLLAIFILLIAAQCLLNSTYLGVYISLPWLFYVALSMGFKSCTTVAEIDKYHARVQFCLFFIFAFRLEQRFYVFLFIHDSGYPCFLQDIVFWDPEAFTIWWFFPNINRVLHILLPDHAIVCRVGLEWYEARLWVRLTGRALWYVSNHRSRLPLALRRPYISFLLYGLGLILLVLMVDGADRDFQMSWLVLSALGGYMYFWFDFFDGDVEDQDEDE